MKRFLLFSVIFISLFVFSACGEVVVEQEKNDKFTIYCTEYAQYDWITNLTKGLKSVNVNYCLENGSDLHNYQPSASDIMDVKKSDICVYTGGVSDKTFKELENSADRGNTEYINLMSLITDRLLPNGDEDEITEADPYSKYDEHIWLSLKNAIIICEKLSDKLVKYLPQDAEKIKENTTQYINSLKLLDEKFTELSNNPENKPIIITDRFPFKYFMNDYSFDYYAAFGSCSTESSVGFKVILDLASKIDEYNIAHIFVVDNSSNKALAESVLENTTKNTASVSTLNSMQHVSKSDMLNGLTYYSAMKENCSKIKNALTQ